MKKEPPEELVKVLGKMARQVGGEGPFHISAPRICDRCQDEEKEAFPYGAVAAVGGYKDLCNDCFDEIREAKKDISTIRLSVAPPQTAEEKDAIALWRQATPQQRLRLIVEARRVGLLLSGKVKPWEMEDFIKESEE